MCTLSSLDGILLRSFFLVIFNFRRFVCLEFCTTYPNYYKKNICNLAQNPKGFQARVFLQAECVVETSIALKWIYTL